MDSMRFRHSFQLQHETVCLLLYERAPSPLPCRPTRLGAEWLAQVAESIDEQCSWVWDPKTGRITYSNAFERFWAFRRPRPQRPGRRPLMAHVHADDRARLARAREQLCPRRHRGATPRPASPSHPGRPTWCRLPHRLRESAFSVRGPGGELLRVTHIARDDLYRHHGRLRADRRRTDAEQPAKPTRP